MAKWDRDGNPIRLPNRPHVPYPERRGTASPDVHPERLYTVRLTADEITTALNGLACAGVGDPTTAETKLREALG